MCLAVPAETYLAQVLERVFPNARVERKTLFLSEAQVRRAKALADADIPNQVVFAYRGVQDGELVGTAYFDSHRVRTLPEILLIVVDPAGRLAQLEVVVFKEPKEYMASDAWYAQFVGEPLHQELQLKRDIHGITGATLTARATTDAVRRVLAIHQVVSEEAQQ